MNAWLSNFLSNTSWNNTFSIFSLDTRKETTFSACMITVCPQTTPTVNIYKTFAHHIILNALEISWMPSKSCHAGPSRVYSRKWPMAAEWAPFFNFRGAFFSRINPGNPLVCPGDNYFLRNQAMKTIRWVVHQPSRKVWITVYISTCYNKSTATSSLTERRESRIKADSERYKK